jgi:hypothetical protein
VLTALVVVITANHFWADGIVAVGVLALCGVLEAGAARVVVRLWQRVRQPAPVAEAGAWS